MTDLFMDRPLVVPITRTKSRYGHYSLNASPRELGGNQDENTGHSYNLLNDGIPKKPDWQCI
jgi:hypothetical protein